MGNPNDQERPWRDAEILREYYVERGLTQPEVGEKLGCSQHTVSRWLDRHGIETGSPDPGDPWRDAEILREYYVERGMALHEVGEKLGCSRESVRTWLDHHGIERRGQGEYASRQPAAYYVTEEGYGEWSTSSHADGNLTVGVHRLAAVAWFGFDAVVGMDVHHKQGTPHGVPEINAEWNLEPLTKSEHTRRHHEQGDYLRT